ncbi:F-box/kelch-repeat protein At3g23880-like [Lotus japonicus]|uniref:F-box/kelch-repeat protein At3g23880-like n=1 Tax=Lotus japonicus TaxID=34305 RepID=UPI002584180B|nr:F-box/kelch-repeat protein At3g23880-like [Lotus japonicus]XP_057436195.1 F-box/kelch-repeat protein At3g23880-like [Lotus japonicus]XP_057436196.1 F-box/kelch-repeat protein At3g23880-like [Lotus japonicus]XP_057436197.1 F-box/kelch-repeat protein At3g23880-like [Lotus japonicus]
MNNDMNEIEKEKEFLNFGALPHELIVEILLRLPVRSLVRFKSVCTAWRSLISNPQFGKSHFDLAASPTHRLLRERFNNFDISEIESFDLKASLHDDSAVVNLKFPPHSGTYIKALGSCRGFIMLTSPKLGDLILWNPSTGAHKEIPATYVDWDSWYDPSTSTHVRRGIPPYFAGLFFDPLSGFGYDQSKDDYLLVIIRLGVVCEPRVKFSLPRIEVVSLITNVPSFYYVDVEYQEMLIGYESLCGIFFDKSLHWLVKSKATWLHAVIAFDLVERSLSEIPLSPDLAAALATYERGYLRVLGGCLSVCYSSGGRHGHEVAEIWVMKDYKVQSSWTKSFVLTIHGLVNDMNFFPMFFTEGGGVFGLDESGTYKKFDDDGELLETYEDRLGRRQSALRYFDMYRESILTLPELAALPDDFVEENEDA